MSHWNYRVCAETHECSVPGMDPEESFSIREVHYNDNGEVWGITEDAIGPCAESLESLKDVLRMMSEALDEPVIEMDDFVYAKYDAAKENSDSTSLPQD